MAKITALCLYVSALISVVVSQNYLPPSFKKCSASDKNCIIEQTQAFVPVFAKGIPEIKVKQIDPMYIKSFKFSLAGLTMDLKDAEHIGYSMVKIDDVSLDFKKNVLTFIFHGDYKMRGKYQASGRLIVLPIAGDGDMTANFTHLNIKLTMPFEITKDENDGKDRLALKSYTLLHWIKGNDNAHFKLTNLFNGNQQLASTLETFIDSNGELITNELGRPILDTTVKVIFKQMRKLFDAYPIDDLVIRN